MAAPADQVRTLYRTMLVFDIVAILILVIGFGEFAFFERPGEATDIKAKITGIYQYDPERQTTIGSDRSTFARTEVFAAVIDWSSLPGDLTVDARWYNAFGAIVGFAGPGTPTQLAGNKVIPVLVPQGLHYNLPGRYMFVVERFEGGLPVEVLARRIVLVER